MYKRQVWTYNRSNVVMPDDGAPFRYSFSALKDRHNAVEVNWIDPDNGWETATEDVYKRQRQRSAGWLMENADP